MSGPAGAPRLTAPNDAKTRGHGYTRRGSGHHSGTVVDGFVFDRKNYNGYEKDGDLRSSQSDKARRWRTTSSSITSTAP